ncbi:MAG: tripeptidyl-peptidase Serine peptidase family [Marmoricola sp.]|nr:tripeptidyl-peptidase Serine peptidase family [Marmoricola sp.]
MSLMPRLVPLRRRSSTVAVALIGVVALAITIAGCSTTGSGPATGPVAGPGSGKPTAAMPSTASALARFYDQKLSWNGCNRDRCTTLTVPLDYAHPDGATLKLAVLDVPAQKPSERLGSLVVNPGGPGGSGVQFAAAGSLQFGDPLSNRYDIIGFDPRGVGSSDPLKCADTAQLDATLAFDPDPDTAAERVEGDRLIHGLGEGCLKNSGDLARHMSTVEVAKDMDILRAALGESKLDYLGSSYGTFIGATYAGLFPTHVGRFVLDGAIDPALSNAQLSLEQAHGFETALRAYLADCVARGSCVLGSTVDQAETRIQQFFAQLDQTPIPTGSSRVLTEGLGMIGIWLPLYVKTLWPDLTSALKKAIVDHDGSALLALSDEYTDRGPSSYTDNSIEALDAVNCLDHDDFIPSSQVPAHFAQFEKASATFGRAFAFSLSTCSKWPVHSGVVSKAIRAPGAPPIVVVGTTRDPATPLVWAQALARELDSGRLITRDGDGHTGFRMGNACVDNAVQNWLLDGTVPRAGLHC